MTVWQKARATFASQRGVAMVTVLFVGAALTAVASVAAYTTIQELQSARDDRKAVEAFAYAESGVDRLVLELRRGQYTWGDIREAGCQRPALTLPDGSIGAGTYDVELVAFDPFAATPAARFPAGGACAAVPDTSPSSNPPHYFAVTSIGQHPASRRVIRYVVAITALDLPVGIYAESTSANGTPNFINISMVTPGDVTGRDKMGFSGTDPYYKINKFWSAGFTASELNQQIPAALHAVGHVFLKTDQQNSREHNPGAPMNCTANKPGSPLGQSMWDQSVDGGGISGPPCAGWSPPGSPAGPPPTSLFTKAGLDVVTPKPTLSDQDYLTLRDAAKQTGLYCFVPTAGTAQCTTGGTTGGGTTVTDAHIATPAPIPNKNFIAFFDFQDATKAQTLTNTVSWDTGVEGCNPSDPGRSVVVIIRAGSLRVEAGHFINGALIAPEGTVTMQGLSTLNGTIIARQFETNGNPTMQLNPCWVANMPGPFLNVIPFQWSEIDR